MCHLWVFKMGRWQAKQVRLAPPNGRLQVGHLRMRRLGGVD
jgi:hypothetical protein